MKEEGKDEKRGEGGGKGRGGGRRRGSQAFLSCPNPFINKTFFSMLWLVYVWPWKYLGKREVAGEGWWVGKRGRLKGLWQKKTLAGKMPIELK